MKLGTWAENLKTPELLLRALAPALLFLHFCAYALLAWGGWSKPGEVFGLLLLGANLGLAVYLVRGSGEILEGLGYMLLIAFQGLAGSFLAPDALTSGAMLMVNLLSLYVGLRLFRYSSVWHQVSFLASYILLFLIFIFWLPKAEPLFLLALM